MDVKTFVLAASYTIALAAALPVTSHNSIIANTEQVKQQTQQTTISLSLNELRQPHTLSVSASATQLTGQIELDGKFIQNLSKNNNQINLSPILTPGRNVVKISGSYIPTNSSVSVEFIGPNTQINQAAGGSGTFSQILIIDVGKSELDPKQQLGVDSSDRIAEVFHVPSLRKNHV